MAVEPACSKSMLSYGEFPSIIMMIDAQGVDRLSMKIELIGKSKTIWRRALFPAPN